MRNATKCNAFIYTLERCTAALLAPSLHIQLRKHLVAQSRLWYLGTRRGGGVAGERQQTEEYPCTEPKGWTGEIQSAFFFFVPVRNLLEANEDAEGRRFEIFQVSLRG